MARHEGVTTIEDAERLLQSDPGEPSEYEFTKQRVQRYLVDESALRHELEGRFFEFMPSTPRSIKRGMNHLRLQLALMVNRDLSGDPVIETSHVAKWVVLGYRWPRVMTAVVREPTRLSRFEGATTEGHLTQMLDDAEIQLSAASTDDLREFLRHRPLLGGVAERLASPNVSTASGE